MANVTETLLVSASFVRGATSISENVDGNYLLPSIREAQDIAFRSIVGDTLLDSLKDQVYNEDVSTEAAALLDKAKYFLAYSTVVDLIPKVAWKIGNFGIMKSSDENLTNAEPAEVDRAIQYYQEKADSEALKIQNFLLNNRSDYPELCEGDVHRIHANLYSSASCGINLGGARGKGWRKCR